MIPEYMMCDGKCRQCREYLESTTCQCGNEKPIEEQLCLHCWTLANNFPCECGCEQ